MKWFRYGAGLLLLTTLFFLPDPNEDYLFLQAVRQLTKESLQKMERVRSLEGELRDDEEENRREKAAILLTELIVEGGGPESGTEHVEREIRRLIVLDEDLEHVFIGLDGKTVWHKEPKHGQLVPDPDNTPHTLPWVIPILIHTWKSPEGADVVCDVLGSDPPSEPKHMDYFNVASLLPPMLAILLALLFQRPLLALLFGVLLGATLVEGFNPLLGIWRFLHTYLYKDALLDQFRLNIIGFVIALCAAVGILTRGAGIQGLVNQLLKLARTVRSTQFVTYLMGIAIFFDDYANCIIVGNTIRPLTDKIRISREKLSYIVDSTAAPIAGISMLSTWIAYEVSMFAPQLPEAGIQKDPYEIFILTLPYRFYCILALVFIALLILFQRDFGPMLKAERRARRTGQVIRPEGKPLVSTSLTKIQAKEGAPARWYNAVLPIVLILLVTVEELWRTGGGWDLTPEQEISLGTIREILGAADSTQSIFIGALAGLVLASILVLSQGILSVRETAAAAARSTKALFFAVAILLLAWCIGGVCADIGTAHYLIALFKGVIHPVFFPTVLFITSCLVAFATGSSWSTMAIILPNTVLFAVLIGEDSGIDKLDMLVISIGAVLEGSIFGDHCSPISDTTILSSVSSASDHMDHVKTQAPYALFVMVLAIFAGYIPAACGTHPIYGLLAGGVLLVLGIFLLGRKTDAEQGNA